MRVFLLGILLGLLGVPADAAEVRTEPHDFFGHLVVVEGVRTPCTVFLHMDDRGIADVDPIDSCDEIDQEVKDLVCYVRGKISGAVVEDGRLYLIPGVPSSAEDAAGMVADTRRRLEQEQKVNDCEGPPVS